jgi:hypothetical protein
LETRELLSTLLEGLAANDLSGTTVAPLGNIFDDPSVGLVGDDFAISAPLAGGTGEVYVIFGGPHLDQPRTLQGCIAPPVRVLKCSFISSLLSFQDLNGNGARDADEPGPRALRIVGDETGDLFGYAVAGVGNAIGDVRPDILIGAPLFDNPLGGVTNSGRAYLIGGEVIAAAISAANVPGVTTPATINVSPVLPITTIHTFTGEGLGDEVGNSVAGLGNGAFIIGAPNNDSAGRTDNGAAYIFTNLRGLTGSGELTPKSTVQGPSSGGHLGGVPAGELTGPTGFRGYGVSGIRNPALIRDELAIDARYNVIDTLTPDVLVGAPDACVDSARPRMLTDCADTSRNGLAFLLSGLNLLETGGTFDLASDVDLKNLSAIPVQGAGTGDRLGSSVSGAGNFDGDLGPKVSDFMIAAPRRDVGPAPTIVDAGEVYLVFGREVNDTPFPNTLDGNCRAAGLIFTGPQTNFRQCRDELGLVVPLRASSFTSPGNQVGWTLRGDIVGEQAGVALAEARNHVDPPGRSAAASPGQVGVDDIIIGSPFRDRIGPGIAQPDVGRAYVLFGDSTFSQTSGAVGNLSSLGPTNQLIFEGRNANDRYGISVGSAGNTFDPLGQIGDDILIGANQVDVALAPPAVAPNVGETELFFGNISGIFVPITGPSLLPFTQPGPFGAQAIAGGYWSFNNYTPPGGDITRFPLCASQPQPVGTVAITDVAAAEGNFGLSGMVFTVTLLSPSTNTVTVDFTTSDIDASALSATAGVDYLPTSGVITFLPGETIKTITVLIVGDLVDELSESFFVHLQFTSNGTIAKSTGVGIIVDDDPFGPEGTVGSTNAFIQTSSPQFCIVQVLPLRGTVAVLGGGLGPVVYTPGMPGNPLGDFLYPPYTVPMLPLASIGPSITTISYVNTSFYPGSDQPLERRRRDRNGNGHRVGNGNGSGNGNGTPAPAPDPGTPGETPVTSSAKASKKLKVKKGRAAAHTFDVIFSNM